MQKIAGGSIFRFYFSRLIFLSVLFTGCASIPTDEVLKDIANVPKNFRNTNTSNLESKLESTQKSSGKSSPKNLREQRNIYTNTFFNMFDDEILKELTLKALKSNMNLLTLESKVRQARATAKINTAGMFPQVSANGSYNHSNNTYSSNYTSGYANSYGGASLGRRGANISMQFSWELDILGKLNALRMASDQNTLGSMQNLSQAQVVLISDVANYYFNIRQIKQSMKLNESITKNLEEIYNLTQQRYDLGLIGLDGVATAKSNYLNQKNTTLNLAYSLEQNKNALLVLLNSQDLDFDVDDIDYVFALPRIPHTSDMPVYVIFNRPDVRSSVFSLNASIYQRYNKKMALFPSLNLSSSLGQILYSPQTSIGGLALQIAGSLAMPLINRESITQDYIIAKENTKQAFYTMQNTINTALGEIENAIKNIEITKQTLDNTTQNYEINKDTYEIMESKYEQNLIDDISKLEYANTYLRSKDSLLLAHLTENQAAIALYKAFGGDFSPEGFTAIQHTKVPDKEDSDMDDVAEAID